MKIGMLHSGIRGDEKLLIESAERNSIDFEPIDIRKHVLNPNDLNYWKSFDVFLERSVSTVKGNALIEFLDNMGLLVVNDKNLMNICNDKFQTACALDRANVPNLKSILVFDEESAKQAVEYLGGYPVVIKSRFGSWGRLIAKINDSEALEGIIDHKTYLGPEHSAVVIQEYIHKPDRDIRAFVIDGVCIAAIYRYSSHWITNTARGGKAENCPVTKEIQEISKQASDAVGGGVIALDIFETNDGLKINEINHTMEFKNSEAPTGVSISEEIIKYCINQVKNRS
jgi:[lysine-biosynthesis-protein LysW]---L-2-aminoadipate ligase